MVFLGSKHGEIVASMVIAASLLWISPDVACAQPSLNSELKKRKKTRNRLARVANADFGSFVIGLGIDAVNFTDLSNYEDYYGAPSSRLSFGFDFYPLTTRFFAFGAGFRLGTYSDSGYARYRPTLNADLIKDVNGETSLALQQIDVSLNALITPFPSQFISFGLWAGYSQMNFAETRAGNALANDSSGNNEAFVNDGSRAQIVSGVSLMVDITPLEESSVYSMIQTIGVDRVFMSPYVATYVDVGDDGANFSNQSMGLMFNFESAK